MIKTCNPGMFNAKVLGFVGGATELATTFRSLEPHISKCRLGGCSPGVGFRAEGFGILVFRVYWLSVYWYWLSRTGPPQAEKL